jgi:fucose 4-O-acetylase-like acetyltransferase
MPGALSLTTARVTPERDESIDVARGIAIILVVLGHNRALSSAWPALVGAIFLFHVPLFFFLSGRVLRPEHPLRAAPKLAARLLVPFALAALLVGAAKCLTRGESPVATLSGILWATGQTLPWSHLWFLPALFLALLSTHTVALVLGQDARRWAVAVVLAVVASAAVPMVLNPAGWPWSLDLLPLCLLFVWAGQWLRNSPSVRSAALHPLAFIVAALAFAAMVGTAAVDLNMRVFAPFFAALAAAVAGCVVTMKTSQWLSHVASVARPLALIGRHTLVIFILHVSVQKALLGVYPGDTPSGAALGILGFATSAAAIAITLLISLSIDYLRVRRSGRHDVAPSEAR